jgi:lysophospholipase L1-like esterase
MPFTLYVAIGDSMSTDHYPTCDVRGLDAPPARLDPLGAAALLHRNDDARWPEFRGLDLETLSPDVEFLGLAEDGAMIDDVATEELARIGRDSTDPDILLTVTAGGNDLLHALAAGRKLESAVALASRRFVDLVETVREELPRQRLPAADAARRCTRALPRTWCEGPRAGALVLEQESDRAQRARRERDPTSLVGGAGAGRLTGRIP